MTDMDRGKDYEPDIYATHEDDYEDFDVEEAEEGGSRAAIILLVVIGVVLLLGVAYVSYRMGYENGQREASVPRLQANAQGGKVEPADPGGLAPPEESALDSSVTAPGEEEFAQLLPREESVIEVPAAGGSEASPGIEIPETLGVGPDMAAMEPEEAPETVPVESPKPKRAEPRAEPRSEPRPEPEAAPGASSRIMVPKPGALPPPAAAGSPGAGSTESSPPPATMRPPKTIPAPAAEVPAPSAVVPPASAAPSGPAPNAGTNGEYVVQLASLPSQEAADAAWRNTSAKFPDLLGNAIRDIEEADLGERGVFYRLRVGYFATRTEANRLCETLKTRGQDCLVKAR